MPISIIQQNDCHTYIHIHILFLLLSFRRDGIFLCYAVEPHYFSILNVIVFIIHHLKPQFANNSTIRADPGRVALLLIFLMILCMSACSWQVGIELASARSAFRTHPPWLITSMWTQGISLSMASSLGLPRSGAGVLTQRFQPSTSTKVEAARSS